MNAHNKHPILMVPNMCKSPYWTMVYGGVFDMNRGWDYVETTWNNCCNVDIVYICVYNQHFHNGTMGLYGYIMDYSMDYGWLMFYIIIFNAIRQTRLPKIDFRTQWIPADWDDLTWRLFPGSFKAPGLCLEKNYECQWYNQGNWLSLSQIYFEP